MLVIPALGEVEIARSLRLTAQSDSDAVPKINKEIRQKMPEKNYARDLFSGLHKHICITMHLSACQYWNLDLEKWKPLEPGSRKMEASF